MSDTPLKVWLDNDGQLLRLRLNRPKANIIDAEMIAALSAALSEHRGNNDLKALVLDAEGAHFSFGASVEEHLPEQCAGMLKGLHRLVIQMLEFPAPRDSAWAAVWRWRVGVACCSLRPPLLWVSRKSNCRCSPPLPPACCRNASDCTAPRICSIPDVL